MSLAPSADSSGQSRPAWVFLLSTRWLCWHAFVIVATLGMLWLGDWQLNRAESGNELSWAYTFEWPVFAVFVMVFWFKSLRDELRLRAHSADPDPGGHGGLASPGIGDSTGAPTPGRPQPQGSALDGASVAAGTTSASDADEVAREAHLAMLLAEVHRHRQRRAWR